MSLYCKPLNFGFVCYTSSIIAKKECVLLCLRAKYERIYKAEPVNVNKTVCLGNADLSRQERERNAEKPREKVSV